MARYTIWEAPVNMSPIWGTGHVSSHLARFVMEGTPDRSGPPLGGTTWHCITRSARPQIGRFMDVLLLFAETAGGRCPRIVQRGGDFIRIALLGMKPVTGHDDGVATVSATAN